MQPYNSYYPGYIPYTAPQIMQQNQQSYYPQSQQIQNGGFVFVQSEDEAQRYAVAPGTSVTFKNVNSPYLYEKTMGFSQLDRPNFKRYRLIDETEQPQTAQPEQPVQAAQPDIQYALKSDLQALGKAVQEEITAIRSSLNAMNEKKAEFRLSDEVTKNE